MISNATNLNEKTVISSTNNSVFVGGLKASFKEPTIRDYFKKFGEIDSIDLKMSNKQQNVNRGFCVVKFKLDKTAERVLEVKDHFIKKRLVTCRPYLRGQKLKESKSKKDGRKIYISGLSRHTTNDDIHEAFQVFGKVEAGYTLKDGETGFSKGFGFVTFEEDGVAQEVLKMEKDIFIKGMKVSVAPFISQKKSEEDEKSPKNGISKDGEIHTPHINTNVNNYSVPKPVNIINLNPLNNCFLLNNLTNGFSSFNRNGMNQDTTNTAPVNLGNLTNGISQIKTGAIEMKRKECAEVCMPQGSDKKVSSEDLSIHQMLPTKIQYHKMMSKIVSKAWHDIDVQNLKLRVRNGNGF